MKTITVNVSQKYDIIIGDQILDYAVNNISFSPNTQIAVIISDSNVYSLHGRKIHDCIESSGLSVIEYIVPAGEQYKNANTYIDILNFLAENSVSRSDIIFAFGGGVIGDIAGFVASTYLRGINYIQVPTTLLAMVDSAIGGKTAIDLKSGKNLVGAFYHPMAVFCDLSLLNTLPDREFRNGCAEIIKYAVLFDSSLFNILANQGMLFDREEVICRCIQFKCDIISKDERDHQDRKLLNLGHTIGHAIEVCSDYSVSHGEAIAVGMCIISCAAAANHLCKSELADTIASVIRDFHLPTNTVYTADMLCGYIMHDKKRAGSFIDLVLPVEIGKCSISTLSIHDLKSFIEAGM